MAYRNQFDKACKACFKGTNEVCDICELPYCTGCLFQTGDTITVPPNPRDETPQEYTHKEEACLKCFIEKRGEPPAILWQDTDRVSYVSMLPSVEKGLSIPAGQGHQWYQPPRAGARLVLYNNKLKLDTFEALQLLNLLKANEDNIRRLAEETSKVLIAESHRVTDAAIRADLGINQPEEY
jgi:hypothetical protein